MKLLFITLFSLLTVPTVWLGNFNVATKEATTSHKLILLNFSGSDWCGPCIRLRKEILESETFERYASDHLVLVRADFPRQKKNRLPAEQVKLNEALAEKYNNEGKFPYTLLIDEQGKVLKSWDGYPNETPDKFVKEIESIH
ncbi:Thioredoxin Disulfide Isomerase [Arcticibacter svalbardensis MN12-7]|uniref:Thioredoxin Disulfide Isomerase n=1 Tax=Arcticibacter svalbardensis MN12-7 TaxID=1150600 RepID=R9GQW0_9SPHI|nr:thioredoxin family protein [Arcticibacter svalbardensis]EOR93940.1 Thioredoxin Disulfide Isomerase [Arcticibacter svalbardensis MN12-7]